jgi:hypothetical protein
VVGAHDGASHLDERRSQPVQRGDVELGGGVEPARRDRPRRRQHAVAAHQFARAVLADQQVVAVLVEPVGVTSVWRGGQAESGFGGEHLVAQALRGVDQVRICGQQQGVPRCGRAAWGFFGDEYGCSAHSQTVAEPSDRMPTAA